MVISHNLTAMNASRQLGIVTDKRSKSSEKLSSGYKINRAADDAAGLSISEKMRCQIRGLSRGVANCYDGVSVCQVADGALSEVNDMLQRLTELSVKSANGTNSESDRNAIQKEVAQIISEIDRIGETTEFNDLPLFKGGKLADSKVITTKVPPKFDFDFKDIRLKTETFNGSDSGYLSMGITAPKSMNLIYGGVGRTSRSSLLLSYKKDGVDKNTQIELSNFSVSDYTYSDIRSQRTLSYKNDVEGIDIKIIQESELTDGDDRKSYKLSYKTIDNSTAQDLNYSFVFNMDTAYNTDDFSEEYFATINGKNEKLSTGMITNKNGHSCSYSGMTTLKENVDVDNGITLINMKDSMPFSQNIRAAGADHIIVGPYGLIDSSEQLKTNPLDNTLKQNLLGRDKAISVIYEDAKNKTMTIEYGVVDVTKDENLDGYIESSIQTTYRHSSDNELWIQAGNSTWSGMNVSIAEMNSEILGIKDLDLTKVYGFAEDVEYINKVSNAINIINEMRSTIGAQQNRLEHTIKNESNIVENTTAAESRIRDTDMAEEMVEYSKNNILMQAGQSMLAQANQSKQGVMSLLQ